MNEGGVPAGFAIVIAAVVLSAFAIVSVIVGKVLVGF